ncbi:MAG TPA: DUF1778 domain-containing protein [Fluviicoccus sp.]|nr:DUF1778 domain-containing protein [Fluviicoccus sp.]
MPSVTGTSSKSPRSSRLGVRATPDQEAILRRAAAIRHQSLTDFVLDSACQAAEQTLIDQRLFLVSGEQYDSLLELLDQPATDNPGLRELFAKPSPWEES